MKKQMVKWREVGLYNKWHWNNWSCTGKNKLWPKYHTLYKGELKMNTKSKCKQKIIKLSGENSHNPGLEQEFWRILKSS